MEGYNKERFRRLMRRQYFPYLKEKGIRLITELTGAHKALLLRAFEATKQEETFWNIDLSKYRYIQVHDIILMLDVYKALDGKKQLHVMAMAGHSPHYKTMNKVLDNTARTLKCNSISLCIADKRFENIYKKLGYCKSLLQMTKELG